jgi:hypothetical protein
MAQWTPISALAATQGRGVIAADAGLIGDQAGKVSVCLARICASRASREGLFAITRDTLSSSSAAPASVAARRPRGWR